jgi:hypothetical protein
MIALSVFADEFFGIARPFFQNDTRRRRNRTTNW